MTLLLAFLLAFVATAAATPLMGWVATRYGFIDKPHPRRNSVLKPRLGGVALYLGFALSLALTYLSLPDRTGAETARVAGLAAGGFLVLVVGILDDKWNLPAATQLGAQLMAALLAIGSGIMVDRVTNPFSTGPTDSLLLFPLWLAVPFTLFWLAGAMNTINFLDVVDGLAAGGAPRAPPPGVA